MASPSASTAASQQIAASPAAWAQIVAAANQEGQVTLIGPQGSDNVAALTSGFEAIYPAIHVDYQGVAGDQVAPKVLTEVGANRNTTDLLITGTTTTLANLVPAGALDPILRHMEGPDDSDPSAWRNGQWDFADSQHLYNIIFSSYVEAPFIYNTSLVDPTQFSSYRDLLDPRWKGKIIWRNPTQAGGGLAIATFMLSSDQLGLPFIQQLIQQQDVTFSDNDQQILDSVAHGASPIAIGPSDSIENDYETRGLGTARMDPNRMKEGAMVSAGNGSVAVPHVAPHPNALRVYTGLVLLRGRADRLARGAALCQRAAGSKLNPTEPAPGA